MGNQLPNVSIYTDGACSGNPGPGGWGTIVRYADRETELSGGEAGTTNNRMELTALIEGLRVLEGRHAVTVYTDSQYVANGINKGWAKSWERNGWRKKDGKPALNVDLWKALLVQLAKHNVEINWVKGHAGHPENERCDALAVAQSQRYAGR